ncbi:MAG: GNAT family N-acetyltransferase, partial [Solirubrobacterales bacterium]|nr:GNAT family N-acetyltransferase [Solirubrobacterales bacterium]
MSGDDALLEVLESYYDAAPRSAARAERIGPFTLFVSEGAPWPYYARPGDGHPLHRADVERVRARQRALGVPEAFEWIGERHPGLRATVEATGLGVLAAPLLVLDTALPRPAAPAGVRLLAPGDGALAASRAVAEIAFGAPGTATGAAGAGERDAAARGIDAPALERLAERLASRASVTAVAERDGGPV